VKVAGIVLAAGRSSRMGRPKPLLPVEGGTFLARAIAVLRQGGCDPVVAVVAPGEEEERMRRIAGEAGARVVVNRLADAEQVDSLRAGLDAVGDGPEGAVVLPVDVPVSDGAVVGALIRAFAAGGAPIVRPVHADRPGHPVLFARRVWDELREPGLERGARDVVRRHHSEIDDVPIDDAAVERDVDTPAEYRREISE